YILVIVRRGHAPQQSGIPVFVPGRDPARSAMLGACRFCSACLQRWAEERSWLMSDRYARYQRLQFERPHPRVLRILMSNPGKLNAADAVMHNELAVIWRDVDADLEVCAVILAGAGK